jgi:hypothetical protein
VGGHSCCGGHPCRGGAHGGGFCIGGCCVTGRVTTLVGDAVAGATLAEWEARERVSRIEVEGAAVLASAHGEAEDLAQRVALLEGELAEARQAREAAEENSRGLSDTVTDAEQWMGES